MTARFWRKGRSVRIWIPSVIVACVALVGPASAQETDTVLVVYASRTGNTETLAKAVLDGAAAVAGVTAILRSAAEVTDDELAAADGVIIGTPVHWGNASVEILQVVDRIGRTSGARAMDDWRAVGTFVSSGNHTNGSEFARLGVLSALMAMRFIAVGGVTADGRGSIGAQATTGASDQGLSESEIEQARRLGDRVAQVTRRLRAAR